MSWLSLGLKALEPIAKEHLTQFADEAIGGLYGNKSGLGLRQRQQDEKDMEDTYKMIMAMMGLGGQPDTTSFNSPPPMPSYAPPAMQNNIDPNMVPPNQWEDAMQGNLPNTGINSALMNPEVVQSLMWLMPQLYKSQGVLGGRPRMGGV